MNDIESIYEKLGISIRVSDKDRSNYTAYKWKKLRSRLIVCLILRSQVYKHHDRDLVIKIGQLVPEDRERLLQSTSPREILQLFVKWKEGKVSFDIEGDVIKFSVSHVGQYQFQETLSCEKPKRLRRLEILEKKNELSLKVLEDMIKQGIICL
mgnify:FL=1